MRFGQGADDRCRGAHGRPEGRQGRRSLALAQPAGSACAIDVGGELGARAVDVLASVTDHSPGCERSGREDRPSSGERWRRWRSRSRPRSRGGRAGSSTVAVVRGARWESRAGRSQRVLFAVAGRSRRNVVSSARAALFVVCCTEAVQARLPDRLRGDHRELVRHRGGREAARYRLAARRAGCGRASRSRPARPGSRPVLLPVLIFPVGRGFAASAPRGSPARQPPRPQVAPGRFGLLA